MEKADIGLIGLAVMGENLALNMESKGFRVAVYNRSADRVTEFLHGRANGKNILGAQNLAELVESLTRPRKIMLMVRAGKPVDELIDQLLPHLDEGDILIEGGNSHFADTIRRTKYVEGKGLLYIGTGVSGGEEGALLGPSIMPGGSPEAWPFVKPILQAIAAKAGDSDDVSQGPQSDITSAVPHGGLTCADAAQSSQSDITSAAPHGGLTCADAAQGSQTSVSVTPCCDWIGPDGAGHFVKMVHNGIEYGDMQLICEAYHMMKDILGLGAAEMSAVFGEWNRGELSSYLIEITADILSYADEGGGALVDQILDVAGQKGTGKWASIIALDEGVPLTLISEAVYARFLSSLKDERLKASEVLAGPDVKLKAPAGEFIADLRKALYASKIISYAQGFALLHAASRTYGWNLKYGDIAMMWRGGCIIRSAFLEKIKEAFDRDAQLPNLLLDSYFQNMMKESQGSWRNVIATAALHGVPVPAFAAALSYYDGYRCERLPANLLQAQRDYFGAHMYERIDRPGGEVFHTDWTGRGGMTASTTYNA